MATGFMLRHCMGVALALSALPAPAADIQFVGSFGASAAVLSIDGGAPKSVRIGERHGGVTVLAVGADTVTVEFDGRQRVIARGQHFRSSPGSEARQNVVLKADGRGHFFSEGTINGGSVRFVVDTGATALVLGTEEAHRLGIDYRKGMPGFVQTADGVRRSWRVSLDRVRLGAIELLQVEALITEQGAGVVLLGMSFLNRVEMRRDGDTMTLTRRF